MGEENLRKGPWYDEEDERLRAFVAVLGARRWDSVARISGLKRSGKSCRLRWLNYLRPCLKHGAMTPQEEQTIRQLHNKWGNKWAKISRRLPGRTDNEIKNYWRTYLRKKEQSQNTLLSQDSQQSTSSYSNNISSSETSTSDQTNKEHETTITSTKTSSRNIINDNNEIATNDINIGAITMDDYDHYDDNYHKELSDYVIASSPYENRISDWMNMLPEEQSENVVGDFCVNDHTTWCYSIDGISAWDFWDVKWDMDLFNNVNQ